MYLLSIIFKIVVLPGTCVAFVRASACAARAIDESRLNDGRDVGVARTVYAYDDSRAMGHEPSKTGGVDCDGRAAGSTHQIGRASCRERV